MSPFPLREGPCQASTGFLFAHECGQPAAASCPRCGKRVCDTHLVAAAEELVCSTCAEADDEGHEGGTTSHSDSAPDEDDPSYYYKDYGYYGPGSSLGGGSSSRDSNDFTEADGESLRHEDDTSFEEDLGGS